MTQDLPNTDAPLRIGTRGSPLALAQAYETRARLGAAFGLSEDAFEIVVIKTTGDNKAMIDADRPLKEIGNKDLFTKEIEEQLLAGQIDIAVHSTKDMPSAQPDGLIMSCFLPREDRRDAFVSHKYNAISDLPTGAVIGTSSLRRRAQLSKIRPDLKLIEFRGNLQTRLQKLADDVADATFLACAGLNRLDLSEVPATPVDPAEMLPAVAQGAIGIECRADDTRALGMLAAIHDTETGICVTAERAFMRALDGSCETPIAAQAYLSNDVLTLDGEILSPDGQTSYRDTTQGGADKAEAMGRELAQRLLGAAGRNFFDWRNRR